MNIKQCTQCMWYVIEQGGLAPGGLNFDCKVRRESTNLEDLFIGHIGAMDAFARGLRIAAAMKKDKLIDGMLTKRYASWGSKFGKKVAAGKSSFEELEKFAKKQGEPKQLSG